MTTDKRKESKSQDAVRRKASGAWFCKQCGNPINKGYSWNGLCVICAEPYTNPEYHGYDHNSGKD